jgi:predicted nuclease with TOPRIM domain
MTLACDALTKEKSQLNSQVKELEAEVTHLKDKLITNRV